MKTTQIVAVSIWWALHCLRHAVHVRERYKAVPHWVKNLEGFLDFNQGQMMLLLAVLLLLQ